MYFSDNGGESFVEQYTVIYLYDELGAPIGFKYRKPTYDAGQFDFVFYEKNLQGDIVALYSESGQLLISYSYDAWGVATTSYTTAAISSSMWSVIASNPFRYRGYYYDTETGFYYLQSRYYNPTWGRFISSDRYEVLNATPNQLTDKNLFAYCDNNPVMRIDRDGEFWISALVGGLVGAAASIVDQLIFDGEVNWLDVGKDAVIGAVTGLLGPTVGLGVSVAINSTISAVDSICSDVVANNDAIAEGRTDDVMDTGDIIVNAFASAGTSALFTYVGGPASRHTVKGFSKIIKEIGKELVETSFSSFSEWISEKLIYGAVVNLTEW